MKKVVVGAVILAGIAMIGYAWYTFTGKNTSMAPLHEALAPGTSLALCITSFDNLEQYLPWLHEMAQERQERAGMPLNPISEWAVIVSSLDSMHDASEAWKTFLSRGAVISASASARGDQWLLGIPSTIEDAGLIDQWLSSSNKSAFKGHDIFHYAGSDRYGTWKNGFWYCAPSKSMIEEVLLRERINKDPLIERSFGLMSVDIPLHFLAPVSNNGWLQLDPLFSAGTRKLSGYFLPADSASTLLHYSPGEGAGRMDVAHKLPRATTALCVWSSVSATDAQVHAAEFYAGTSHEKYWSVASPLYSDSCQCMLDDALYRWRGEQWGTAIISRGDSIHHPVAFYQKNDSTPLSTLLKPLLVDTVSATRIHPVLYPEVFRRNEIVLVPVEHRFAAEHGDFLFFSETPDVLEDILLVSDSSALMNEDIFASAIMNLEEDTECSFYRTDSPVALLPEALTRAFAASGFELVTVKRGGGGLPLFSVHFPNDHPVREAPKALASSAQIPTNVQRTWPVINHTTGKSESVVFNTNNELVWIGTDGTQAWSRSIPNGVLGDIVQVDILKNGKLQLLICTQKELLLIDKNGKDVSGFPVSFMTAPVSGAFVFDYDKNLIYRFLIPLNDGSIINLTNNGQPTEGWKYTSTEPVQWIGHLRTGTEDHLIMIHSNGRVSDYKRNGTFRSVFPQPMEASAHSFRLKPGTTVQDSKIVYKTQEGEEKLYHLD